MLFCWRQLIDTNLKKNFTKFKENNLYTGDKTCEKISFVTNRKSGGYKSTCKRCLIGPQKGVS